MRDGMTAKLERPAAGRSFDDFRQGFEARLVLLNSDEAGREYPVETERVTLGRGPGVDLAFDDAAMSRQHAALVFENGAFRLSDLGSTNGLEVNGRQIDEREVGHGDRFSLGALDFQLVVEERESEPDVYELPGE